MNKIYKLAIIIGLVLIPSIAYAVQTGLTGEAQERYTSYTRHHDVGSNAASQGVTAPSPITQDTTRCLGFDADNEQAFLIFEIPPEWDGASDMLLNVDWYPEAGDVLVDAETVKWDMSYRSIADNEAIDNGTLATASATYTQSGAGTDKEAIETQITIDYDGANQPLTAHDEIIIVTNRDVTTDTYSGSGVICKWELEYTANKLATH